MINIIQIKNNRIKKLNIKGIVLGISITCLLSFNTEAKADKQPVAYSGIYTTGKSNKGNNFQNFERNKLKIVKEFKGIFEELSNQNKLPFNLLFETDSEDSKLIIDDNTYSLAVVMTRDDINKEYFNLPESNISLTKTYINVGMVVIVYQNILDSTGKPKSSILFSLPLTGYSRNLSGNENVDQSFLDNEFIKISKSVLKNELVKKLENITLNEIEGNITSLRENEAVINIGSLNGLTKSQYVKILDTKNKVVSKGKIKNLGLNESVIEIESNPEIVKGSSVSTTNIKGFSDETYQVVNFKISSEKCQKWFDKDTIALQASQWFSDFLSEKAGKLVLPSKVGGAWIDSANEQSYAVLMKDGQQHLFEMAKPKYEVTLDITGLSDKKIEESSNAVNENWIYKLWFKVDILSPDKKFSKEFDMISNKTVLTGAQKFEEKNEVFDLLHQLTAKSAREIE